MIGHFGTYSKQAYEECTEEALRWFQSGVGNDFFSRGVQGVDLVLELRGISGGGFLDSKIDQF